MEKHPHITLKRIRRVMEELQQRLWVDHRPVRVSIYQTAEPIPYAEAIQQQYTPVEVTCTWGPPWSTAWFHVEGDYPAEWTGNTVALLMDTSSEALVWVNGAPAQGLDNNRSDFIIEDRNGTGTVDLFIEAAGNDLFGGGRSGMGDRAFTLRTACLARLNTPVWDCYHDLRVLLNLAEALPEESARRAQLIYALNEAVNEYRHLGEAGIDAARAALQSVYAQPACPSASTVMATGHSHIDTAWLWPIRETKRKCSRTFSTVLKYMERYPEYRYTQSQPQLYAFVKELYPELYARIKQAVAEGRWEPQGAMWVEADCNLSSGESLVRQILYGKQFFREEFGVDNTVLWLPDVFGYSAALPQILQGCGVRYFMTQKISWSQFNKFPHNTFWWEGIDGTQVMAHFLTQTLETGFGYNGMMTPEEVVKCERGFKEKDRANTWLYLYGHGDGGGGVTKEMLEAARRMQNLEGLPRIQPGFARDWFSQVEATARDLRTWAGELYLEYHRGTYTTQAKNKWENRRCEFLLRDAECLAALHPDGTQDYPADELARAWKLVLLNQFHDIIPGSSIRWVYEDSANDYATVHAIGESVVEKALDTFTAQVDTATLTNPVMVWNTLSFPRNGLLEVAWAGTAAAVHAVTPDGCTLRTQRLDMEDGQRLLVEAKDIPAMGYSVLDLREGSVPSTADMVTATERTLENAFVHVEINENGEVVSLFDMQTQREVLAPGAVGNQFQLFDDTPNDNDAWDIDPFFDEVQLALTAPAVISVAEAGPLRATLRIERTLTPQSSLVQSIRLQAGSPRIDFETVVDWHESRKLLKVAFPVDISSPRATYEIQYGHVERPTHRNTTWDVARFEVPAQKWADLSEGDYGVALLNDSKHGYDVLGNVLRLTLLRAPKSPDAQADMGAHHFTYSLLPHQGDLTNSTVPQEAYALNVPLLAHQTPVQPGTLPLAQSYFQLEQPNLIIESVKRAEDGEGIIIRLYEAFRRRGAASLHVQVPFTRAMRTNLLEEPQEALPVDGNTITFPFKPFEIITIRLQ